MNSSYYNAEHWVATIGQVFSASYAVFSANPEAHMHTSQDGCIVSEHFPGVFQHFAVHHCDRHSDDFFTVSTQHCLCASKSEIFQNSPCILCFYIEKAARFKDFLETTKLADDIIPLVISYLLPKNLDIKYVENRKTLQMDGNDAFASDSERAYRRRIFGWYQDGHSFGGSPENREDDRPYPPRIYLDRTRETRVSPSRSNMGPVARNTQSNSKNTNKKRLRPGSNNN